MTYETLLVDAKLDTLASQFLLDHDDTVLGFGQYYQRLGHCHLGRLVIAPDQRGRGLGKTLIDKLAAQGQRTLDLGSQSLFVLKENGRAKKLYERLGFKESPYPGDDIDWPEIIYMTRIQSE